MNAPITKQDRELALAAICVGRTLATPSGWSSWVASGRTPGGYPGEHFEGYPTPEAIAEAIAHARAEGAATKGAELDATRAELGRLQPIVDQRDDLASELADVFIQIDEWAGYDAEKSLAANVAAAVAALNAIAQPRWSKERPTEPGWYWVRNAPTLRVSPTAVAVAWGAGDMLCGEYGHDYIPVVSDWWDGAEWCPAVAPC